MTISSRTRQRKSRIDSEEKSLVSPGHSFVFLLCIIKTFWSWTKRKVLSILVFLSKLFQRYYEKIMNFLWIEKVVTKLKPQLSFKLWIWSEVRWEILSCDIERGLSLSGSEKKASFYFLCLEQSLPLLDFLNKRIDIDNLSQLVLNLSSFVQFYPKLQSSTKPARMPPPGGTGGTAGWGFIKEKPDPWEVTLDILF